MSSTTAGSTFDPAAVANVLCDLDGVVWLRHAPIPGAVESIAALRASGRRVVFVTNNSMATVQGNVDALGRVGVPAVDDVVSSAQAGARLVHAGERVLVVGGEGILEAVSARGAIPTAAAAVTEAGVAAGQFDAVVVGLDRRFDYDRLAAASAAVRTGARLIATNTDATYPTDEGLLPGGGSIVAAVATAAGVEPVVAGKPHQPMIDLVADVLGTATGFDPGSTVMVGDRPDTDGRFAAALGCGFVLVRSGVTPPGVPVTASDIGAEPVADLADLAAVGRWLAPTGPARQ